MVSSPEHVLQYFFYNNKLAFCAERSYPASEVRGGREELPHALTPEARGGGWEAVRDRLALQGGTGDFP